MRALSLAFIVFVFSTSFAGPCVDDDFTAVGTITLGTESDTRAMTYFSTADGGLRPGPFQFLGSESPLGDIFGVYGLQIGHHVLSTGMIETSWSYQAINIGSVPASWDGTFTVTVPCVVDVTIGGSSTPVDAHAELVNVGTTEVLAAYSGGAPSGGGLVTLQPGSYRTTGETAAGTLGIRWRPVQAVPEGSSALLLGLTFLASFLLRRVTQQNG